MIYLGEPHPSHVYECLLACLNEMVTLSDAPISDYWCFTSYCILLIVACSGLILLMVIICFLVYTYKLQAALQVFATSAQTCYPTKNYMYIHVHVYL